MKRIFLSVFALALLLSFGGAARAQADKKTAFGALEAMTESAAKEKTVAWLRQIGKADAATMQRFEAIWSDKQRSVLDRLADSFALGDPAAAKLLSEARDPSLPAPTAVPAILKDESASAFYRANLGLLYARGLVSRFVYEEALASLQLFNADQVVDPAAFLFHRAVCEHQMRQRADATRSILRLLEEGAAASPERYKSVATLMLLDMHTWKDKDLGDIAGKMGNIQRRLDIARGGPETQRQQREVLNRLDELIKKLENADKNKKKKPGDGQPKPGDGPPKPGDGNGDECPDGNGPPMPGNGPPKGVQKPTSPATESADAGGNSSGVINQEKFKKAATEWARLPPAERDRLMRELTQGLPPHLRDAIETYFKNLNNPNVKRN